MQGFIKQTVSWFGAGLRLGKMQMHYEMHIDNLALHAPLQLRYASIFIFISYVSCIERN